MSFAAADEMLYLTLRNAIEVLGDFGIDEGVNNSNDVQVFRDAKLIAAQGFALNPANQTVSSDVLECVSSRNLQ